MFGLNKLADKDFVIGFILPVLIAGAALVGLFYDFPPLAGIVASLTSNKAFASLTLIVLILWAAATLLMTFNRWLYRILEGYFGPLKRERLRTCLRERCERRANEIDEMYGLCGFPDDDPSFEQKEARSRYVAARADFLVAFPGCELTMPTRFGNVIKAFETYSNRVYGLDGVAGWTRLIGVIPASYAAVINDARAEVDFCVNVCALAFLIGLLALARALWNILGRGALGTPDLYFIGAGTISMLLAYAANWGAVERAGAWGETVKAAFDLYLPSLAKQLGYDLPVRPKEQADFWDAVTSLILVQVPLNPVQWPPSSPAGDETPAPPEGRREAEAEAGNGDDDA